MIIIHPARYGQFHARSLHRRQTFAMKNILLLHPPLLFYKVRIYNLLYHELMKRGYKLHVWTTHIQEGSDPISFPVIDKAMTIKNFVSIVRGREISIQINTLSKEANIIAFYCFSICYAKMMKMSSIYYGHGLDLSKRNNTLKISIQNLFHLGFNRLLLYSYDQCKYMWKIHNHKIYIAKNTLILGGYRKLEKIAKTNIKNKYGICEKYIVLFSGRISERKNFHMFLKMFEKYFADSTKIGFVVVGPGMKQEHSYTVSKYHNFHYLGPVYDKPRINDIFHMSDVFCVPGSLGLGIVEAMYWGLPVLTMDVIHGPEAMYIRNGYNGFILENMHEIAKMIFYLFVNPALLSVLGTNARSTVLNEAGIERMFSGFYEVLSSLS